MRNNKFIPTALLAAGLAGSLMFAASCGKKDHAAHESHSQDQVTDPGKPWVDNLLRRYEEKLAQLRK